MFGQHRKILPKRTSQIVSLILSWIRKFNQNLHKWPSHHTDRLEGCHSAFSGIFQGCTEKDKSSDE